MTKSWCQFSDEAAVDLIASVQENQKKVALALLEKAKEICANRGVCIYFLADILFCL